MKIKVNPRGRKLPVAKLYKFHGISLHMVQSKFPVEVGKLSRNPEKLSRPFLVSKAIRECRTSARVWVRLANVCQIASTPASSFMVAGWPDVSQYPLQPTNLLIIEPISPNVEKIVRLSFWETVRILRAAQRGKLPWKSCEATISRRHEKSRHKKKRTEGEEQVEINERIKILYVFKNWNIWKSLYFWNLSILGAWKFKYRRIRRYFYNKI